MSANHCFWWFWVHLSQTNPCRWPVGVGPVAWETWTPVSWCTHLAIGSLPPSTFPGQPRDPRATRTHAGGELRGRLMATQRLRVSQHGRGQPDMAAAHGNLSTRASRRHLFTGWHHYIGGNVQLVSVNTQVKRRRKPHTRFSCPLLAFPVCFSTKQQLSQTRLRSRIWLEAF